MPLDQDSICAMNFHYVRQPLTRFLDDVAASGVKRVELWGAAPHFYIGDRSLADAAAFARDLRNRGLSLVCFTPEQCVYPVNIAAPERDLRERSICYFMDSLEMSAAMESPALLVTPGTGYVSEPEAQARDRSVDALGRIAARAGELGITLFLEALPPAYSNIARTAAELRVLLEAVNAPALTGMLDTGGACLLSESVQDYIATLGPLLGHVHMIDSDSAGSHLAWGDGMLSAPEIIAALDAAAFRGSLSIELTSPRYYLDPEAPMRRSVACLRAALGNLRTKPAAARATRG